MPGADALVPVLALLWAGVSLGGSLVAAPAKFRAPSLDRPTALEVGRAQFLWVGVTEAVLCVALVGALLLAAAVAWWWLAVPIVIFVIQRLVIMPPLDARTRRLIREERVGTSHLHQVYVVLEVVKFASLVVGGVVAI